MAIANWKMPYDKTLPEDYGWYMVTLKNGRVEMAKFTHPNGARATGWYQDWMGHWQEVDIIAWDDLPEGYKPGQSA